MALGGDIVCGLRGLFGGWGVVGVIMDNFLYVL
jgi:hypothetical protein